jgi:CRP/FNR family transcriptional regulator, cyclic AMP receptor protein
MSNDAAVPLLQRIPIFARLNPLQIAEIAQQAEKVKFRSRECITEAGASGDAAYLLVSGTAERLAAPEQPLPPGSLIGELAMLVEHNYGATIVAKGRVHCLKISRSALHDQMLADPSLAELLSQHISERLRKAANGLMRIDHLLAKSEAASARRATYVTAQSAASPVDRRLRAQ